MTTPPEVVTRIEELARTLPTGATGSRPGWRWRAGGSRAITVPKIPGDQGPGSRHERWLVLARQDARQAIEP